MSLKADVLGHPGRPKVSSRVERISRQTENVQDHSETGPLGRRSANAVFIHLLPEGLDRWGRELSELEMAQPRLGCAYQTDR